MRDLAGRVTVADLNAAFRGEVFGDPPAMTAAWFRDHVGHNDVDLGRSPRWKVDGALSGAALLAFRDDRAWVGAFGVVPEFRGRGFAQRYLAETLTVVRDAGARSVELEVLENNAAAIRLYERAGFVAIDQLGVWSRAPGATAADRAQPDVRIDGAGAIAALARTPPACWQREPRSVAAASPFETVIVAAGSAAEAYAFVRCDGERVGILDAGAPEPVSAAALLDALAARFAAHTLVLLNEPRHGPLHDALASNESWKEIASQRRLRYIP
jgi:ribosomal protein S18 acetylase RimI-like enzyme